MEAFRTTRKDGATGIDGVTAADYAGNLEANLLDLLDRIKSGRYGAPPVRRAYIPKADGTQRPLGIPTFEDKVAQRAVMMLLEAIYEQDFSALLLWLPAGSLGARRPPRSAARAQGRGVAVGVGYRHSKYFDSIPHDELRGFLDRRVTDGVIRRMIDKWLKAGAVEDGSYTARPKGLPKAASSRPAREHLPAPCAGRMVGDRGAAASEGGTSGPLRRRSDHGVRQYLDAQRVFASWASGSKGLGLRCTRTSRTPSTSPSDA